MNIITRSFPWFHYLTIIFRAKIKFLMPNQHTIFAYMYSLRIFGLVFDRNRYFVYTITTWFIVTLFTAMSNKHINIGKCSYLRKRYSR